jgi:chorismate dehydratase
LKSLRIGCVKYLNARPLVRGWHGHVEFGHPALLCQQLANGELDVALVSSFEFLRNPIYRIVDDIAIGSDGPVYSVFVAHAHGRPLREIELDPASATAVAMLRYLAAKRDRKFVAVDAPADTLFGLPPDRARLLIGDQAILFRQKFGEQYDYWDLGEEWRGVTNLPFVYALWLIRPEVLDPKPIAHRLRALRDDNLGNLEALIAAEKCFDHAFCRRYYREHLRFSFGEKEKQGLDLFHRVCAKCGLVPRCEIKFATV